MKNHIEILAPAGNFDCAKAAIAGGADAVYFGLSSFNARRRAENIPVERLAEFVEYIHSKNVRAYLALNTDISQRELAEAARYYKFAKSTGVDALIIRDLSFFVFRKFLGDIPLHMSTQAGISSSAGVKTARSLGVARVILAREMSSDEIKASADVEGIDIEIFVQGAMCFSVSGRCLLSSWIGGRSGNRGLCASPCRMEWKTQDSAFSRLMSMKDLSLLKHAKEIAGHGALSFKIEGRLKNPEWVAEAVRQVKTALSENPEEFVNDARLGSYAGRAMTDSFYLGLRKGLTASSGREKSEDSPRPDFLPDEESSPSNCFISISADAGGKLLCSIRMLNLESKIFLKDRGDSERSIGVGELRGRLVERFADFDFSVESSCDAFRFSRSDASKIEKEISLLTHKASKKNRELVRIELPDELLEKIRIPPANCEIRRKNPLDAPDKIRIKSVDTELFVKSVPDCALTIECSSDCEIRKISEFSNHEKIIAALPEVFYEKDIPHIRNMLSACAECKFRAELNNLDAISMANEIGLEWEAGPGLMVLNSFASEALASKGARAVTISLEADFKQMQELSSASSVPLILYVFGRPRLLRSRVHLSDKALCLEEKRGTKILMTNDGGFSTFYPEEPFNIAKSEFKNIMAAQIAVDLVFSPNPLKEWLNRKKIPSSVFNLKRKLR
jgi:putative protease